MAIVRINQFAGLMPEVHGKLITDSHAQIAHNCLLTDGKLRPQAQWVEVDRRSSYENNAGLAYDDIREVPLQYPALDPVFLSGAPFAERQVIGAIPGDDFYESNIHRFKDANPQQHEYVGIREYPITATITYTRSYDSIKPVNRMYAATRVRRYGNRAEEGPLVMLDGQDPKAVVYEGDLVSIQLNPDGYDSVNAFRLYRSVTGLDTGQATTNDLDTNWHLVDEIPFQGGMYLNYTDGASATASPLDVNYSATFHPPVVVAKHFGLTDSGWFVGVAKDGYIQVSERYMHHAWPAENDFKVPAVVTDATVSGDNVFIGSTTYPWIIALSTGEKALQGKADRYDEKLPCLPNTMTTTPFGAMYASGAGIVSLTRDGIEVITRDLANAGSVFSVRNFDDSTDAAISFAATAFGHYDAGKYYGFCFTPVVYNPPEY